MKIDLVWNLGPLHARPKGRDYLVVKGPRFSSNAHATDMVCRELHHVYPLEVGLKQIMADHEILLIVCHVGIHVDFSFRKFSLDP